jgi:hypothetical protein
MIRLTSSLCYYQRAVLGSQLHFTSIIGTHQIHSFVLSMYFRLLPGLLGCEVTKIFWKRNEDKCKVVSVAGHGGP